MIRVILALLLVASPAAAGVRVGPRSSDIVRCSELPAPAVTPVSVTSSDDLEAEITAACASTDCILELAAGTYADANVRIGTGGVNVAGQVLIRAADPVNKPLLRAEIGNQYAIISVQDEYGYIRLENIRFDGRRGSQTAAAVFDVCADTSPADGICDLADPQSFTRGGAFYTTSTTTASTRSCLLNVEVQDTIFDAIFIRDGIDSTVENAIVTNIGCTAAACPSLSIPSDYTSNAIKTVSRGVNLVDADGHVGVIGSRVDGATKMGFQCFQSDDCDILYSTAEDIELEGISMLDSSGDVVGNVVTSIGQILAPNTLNDNTGIGIGVSLGTGEAFNMRILDNQITTTWGAGIQIAIPPGAPNSSASFLLEENTVTSPCTGTTRPNAAGAELGDNTNTIAGVASTSLRVASSLCDSAIRVQRITDYDGRGTSVVGTGGQEAIIYDDVTGLDDRGIIVDDDISIDAGSAGAITNCTLNSGAAVLDSSAGAVTRTGGC